MFICLQAIWNLKNSVYSLKIRTDQLFKKKFIFYIVCHYISENQIM